MQESGKQPDVFRDLDTILRAEVNVINSRRSRYRLAELGFSGSGSGAPVLDAVGLALSGGGIRSASFSLGVLQAFNEHGVVPRLDYLSTVSGGGYIGSALTATLTTTGEFVLGQSTGPRAEGERPPDVKDTDSVGHLRNYSNYLIPRGARDVLTAAAIVLRGLVANVSLVLPVILLLAAVTILANPSRRDLLGADFFSFELTWLPVDHFGITLLLALIGFLLFLAWGLYRCGLSARRQSEVRTWLPTLGAGYLVLIAASFFCELQPYVLAGMFDLADQVRASGMGNFSRLTTFIQSLAAIATPIAAVVTFFRQQLGTLLKSVTASSAMSTKVLAVASHVAIWIAGAALPLLIWVAYIYLCYWGIINNGKPVALEAARQQPALHGTLQIEGPGINVKGTIDCRPGDGGAPCTERRPPAAPQPIDSGAHTPKWLIATAQVVSSVIRAPSWLPERLADRPITLLYLGLGLLLFALSYMLRPNANSLHRLYRDRLSKAFLFDPRRRVGAGGIDKGRDFRPLDTMPISDLATPAPDELINAPYHLINAALNIQGSDYANRRGRNADFFLFSPCYVGSNATGFVETRKMETASGLDLATAMAISGAAFSSNMGSNSIRALTPTLALLNIRTVYWLKNPRFVRSGAPAAQGRNRLQARRSKWYLWAEISGRLYEDSEDVYITDGGHIENLGLYELLRRRCRIIIVVDAEADPAMRLTSFITLQRYARIDLGVRINMPWDQIHENTAAWMGFGASGSAPASKASNGPHAAIGTIDYDGGKTGWLLYIKSSLTGDENDYVRDYARQFAQFPHESTSDQFFSEEQFESYRALGFHIANRILNGEDKLQVFGLANAATFHEVHANIDPIRQAILPPRSTSPTSGAPTDQNRDR
jgi:hypothetical protein